MLTNNEKLVILNSMEIVKADSDGECLYYAFVEDNEENREKLERIIPNVTGFIKEHASDSETHCADPGYIDIQFAAWDYTNANWFNGKTFEYKEELKDVYI